ncbi:MAG: serine racemase VanT catalytic subunit [Solobacterium sp.]|jgi:serine/alanine racemase|nr:serine racemase VanT catalytic subunit [Solobacterium sp.]MCH4222313.1 serine racemase VanT catalytic subunit [Solobacterium sp.]MCH4265646.1 serine racemase VanT catalytic subunit [Solobacterium sp.]
MNEQTERAWIELDRSALEHNVRVLQSYLPAHCSLMPAVKANAYGHGAVLIAEQLEKLGITSMCVACFSEAKELRDAGIQADLLILGRTSAELADELVRYRLIQNAVSLEYAQQLSMRNCGVQVHVSVDTGMRRLGEDVSHLAEIEDIYHLCGIRVTGLFSHLSCCDGSDPQETAYTSAQIQSFKQLIARLKQDGINPGTTHLLSSYAIMKQLDPCGSLARPGIALYGCLSGENASSTLGYQLKPVLSLHARIAMTRPLQNEEYAGYGMAYQADHPVTIATVTIGYADGIPRCCSDMHVLVHGHRAMIIGRLCMDQLLIDVSGIDDIHEGDIVTLVGTEGSKTITACEWAAHCNTISNELLSRLGTRLPRLWAN